MLLQRRPLSSIDRNATKGKELTLYKRGKIIRASVAGLPNPKIAIALKTLESTVRSTLRYDLQCLNGETRRRIVRLVRAQLKLTYNEVRKELD